MPQTMWKEEKWLGIYCLCMCEVPLVPNRALKLYPLSVYTTVQGYAPYESCSFSSLLHNSFHRVQLMIGMLPMGEINKSWCNGKH